MTSWITFALAASLSFAAVAQTIELPRVNVPQELTSGEFAEGTITRLSAAEVAEFLPWAQNSRNQLNRALTQARALPLRERLPHIERAVRAVVARSGSRQYQMLMRFSLNRGLLLVDELERHVDMSLIGSQESALDLLQRSITVALSFYESDLTFQQRAQSGDDAVTIPHAQFGTAFMQGLYPGVVNVLDATAQYRLLYKLIEMVNWDLSRDAEAPRYAEAIVEAYEMGQDLPEQPATDDRANLRLIRRLNSLRIINLRSTTTAENAESTNEADLPTSVTPPTTIRSAPNTSSQDVEVVRAQRDRRYGVFSNSYYTGGNNYCYLMDREGNRVGDWGTKAPVENCMSGYGTFSNSYYTGGHNYCYRIDARGSRLGDWGDKVSQSHCITGHGTFSNSYYTGGHNYCYAINSAGQRMGDWGDKLSISTCTVNHRSFSNSYYTGGANYCYRVDSRGNRLGDWGDKVDVNNCL